MDRTIKFRVWNGERLLYPEFFGSNAYGSQGQITIGWTNQSYIDLGSIRKQPYEAWEGCILMQFTGLYDSEGKEVWEGQIINNDYLVVFLLGKFQLQSLLDNSYQDIYDRKHKITGEYYKMEKN